MHTSGEEFGPKASERLLTRPIVTIFKYRSKDIFYNKKTPPYLIIGKRITRVGSTRSSSERGFLKYY